MAFATFCKLLFLSIEFSGFLLCPSMLHPQLPPECHPSASPVQYARRRGEAHLACEWHCSAEEERRYP